MLFGVGPNQAPSETHFASDYYYRVPWASWRSLVGPQWEKLGI